MKTIKELEAEIREHEREVAISFTVTNPHWQNQADSKYAHRIYPLMDKIKALKDVLGLIDELDDEHLTHYFKGKSQEYIGAWLDACEKLKARIEG